MLKNVSYSNNNGLVLCFMPPFFLLFNSSSRLMKRCGQDDQDYGLNSWTK